MQLVDYSGTCIANVMQSMKKTNETVTLDYLRHMVLNSLRALRVKFGNEYGELVLACDNKNNWRREIFPYYKASRKTSRDASTINWGEIYRCIHTIREEIEENFRYPVIYIERAEADDVIGTIVHEYGNDLNIGEKLLIISRDKDFGQLHTYGNVKQWNPIDHVFINHSDPVRFLREHIIRGDSGDGIPNILSQDDSFVNKIRQKSMTSERLERFMTSIDESEVLRNFKRNEMLIDLKMTPSEIKSVILESYNSQLDKKNGNLFGYFMKNKLKNLMESMGDF